MGKRTPSAPAAPDPVATAAAQGAVNKETAMAQARLNQINEYTPYGSSVYTDRGEPVDGIQQVDRTTTLDPAQQAIVDQQTAISGDLNTLAGEQIGRVSTNLADPYSYDGMAAAPTADSAARQQVIDSLYNQYTSRLDPRFTDEQTALETSLATQGIPVGSDAYNKAVESFGRTRNDAYGSALNQAVMAGGAEQNRLFGLQGDARTRAIQEYSTQRNAPLNEIAALMGGTTINNPQFSPTTQTGVANTDFIGAQGQALAMANNQYNQQMSARNAGIGGLYGLGGATLGAAGAARGFGNLFG
tara:strand:- start:474 stop:1376 length:903 start_codon:yes stop_codon:yes gene_type:complete